MMRKTILLAVLLGALVATGANAQKRAFTIPDLYRVQYAASPTVSAKGQLAYYVSSSDLKSQTSKTTLYIDHQPLEGIKGFAPQWSADGSKLYYSAVADDGLQVFAYDLQTRQSRQLTHYALGANGAVVSPDGNLIAFAAEVWPAIGGADGKANAEANERKAKAPVQAHLADKLLFRHWTDYTDGKFWHIIIYNIAKDTYTDVTPGEFHSPTFSPSGPEGFTFSPDSKELCYLSNHDPHPEASTNADLWVVPVEGGTARNLTADNKAWDGSPQYSPDGRYIAYRFQTVPGYESDRFRLAVVDRRTGAKTVLTEAFDNWVDAYKWTPDSKAICFLGEERGYEPLFKVTLANKKIEKIVGDRAIGSFDLDGKGNFYYTYSSTGKPTALYRATPSRKGLRERQLTHFNDALEQEVDIRPAEELWVEGANGDSVEVFVVKPHGFEPGKRYPLVINVHGGPQMQWMNSFRGDWQVYPGAGYVVAYPNPHGSTGYGQQFCRDISQDWGGKPFVDVMRVTDALARLDYVDSTRMAAMGWSYGGFFMNWLQGHTKRFKCLASMMGLYDMPSMWGTTEELWFPNFEMDGQPWNSDLYQKWSPSNYVRNFATPTLIITGERDYRVSYTQSLQYFSTLQTLGIPSRLIVFKNDGHWPSTLRSMPLYYNAHLEWFHKYLGGAPAPWKSEDMVNGTMNY
ncbi:MAG: S9 family peptidase [Prevotella sp.]|nr:S9 family peptidase [Bacteroidales bacterium]MDY4230053.1 S9 family peptidase [Prevotella sp.]